ncbi:Hypothetical predicted protein [Olea europaea subsp. europaea]|uniref:Uncharacterized protein n=1 Tax=Olea europaea subsp. europaea TaxID=158383 RepID=A0A8S0T918_OLEEU|nr:Hypothetical predicted protein [Olea europaea subsp. europaea]
MKQLKLSYCPKEGKSCIGWIEKYFKDCLCNLNDEISFGFGIASLICWAVAEIPQIITNFNNKSADGVSLAFLCTWIVGDVFNLVGCILEPATDEDETDAPKSKFQGRLTSSNVPVEVPHRRDFYYMSARSLAGSDSSPMNQCYIKARSGPPALEHDSDSSSEDESFLPSSNEPVIVTQPRNIPRPVGYGTFAAASVNLPFLTRALTDTGGRRSMMVFYYNILFFIKLESLCIH